MKRESLNDDSLHSREEFTQKVAGFASQQNRVETSKSLISVGVFKVSGVTELPQLGGQLIQQSKSSGVAGTTEIIYASCENVDNEQLDDDATNFAGQKGNIGQDSTAGAIQE